TIYFRGLYLLIINKETNNVKTHIDNKNPLIKYLPYEIPTRYTCYIRGTSVYFKKLRG
ncbi:hypothetical protein CC80DRAFT_424748, partial [Byssothecium circinans]